MRRFKEYPVLDTELRALRMWALWSLVGVGIPFLIVETLLFVRRLRKETTFDT